MQFNQNLKMPNVKWRRLVLVCLLLMLGLGLLGNFTPQVMGINLPKNKMEECK